MAQHGPGNRLKRHLAAAALALAVMPGAAVALDFRFETPGADKALADVLRGASVVNATRQTTAPDAQDLFAAARADYGRLLGALYAQGYYSGVIHILIDGREAAGIAPLDAPDQIGSMIVQVTPGPRFAFSRAAIGPLAANTGLPGAFAVGQPARSGAIVDAAAAGVSGWRQVGHAKAMVAAQQITADHRAAQLSADVRLAPGPRVRFGQLQMSGYNRMNPRRLAKIAGFPNGEVFDSDALDRVYLRLNRTGIFSSVALTEAERLGPGNTLDVALSVAEAPLRRFGFGAELSSLDGLNLSGYWLHRNLLGGGERLRLDGAIEGIGGQTDEADYKLGARLDRPATLSPDTSGFVTAEIARLHQEDYTSKRASVGVGFSHWFSETLSGEIALAATTSEVEDRVGGVVTRTTRFRQISLPTALIWDSRDKPLDATQGFYIDAGATPFLGFDTTGTGAQVTADARAYWRPAAFGRVVLAGRVQIGSVLGSDLLETPREYLFYSGGGGTVRGQPYQSLGVNVLRGALSQQIGGRSFLGLSGEVRADLTDKIGAVAFYDAGHIGIDAAPGGEGEWHSGAGLGLRYDTGIGPIRLDVAAPVAGNTGEGVQVYIGIGQAF
ncbi:autotransporter assembly complex protein TamA [Phaeovulum veldkampii]|nr:autotransporter assembly complex family protein [Phaeovulum veldkampii]TDQ56691.1 autotransporter secretion outer membrane protein TamA [Phaeovulum veldkampii DSM 11550]